MALKNNKTVDRLSLSFFLFLLVHMAEELYISPKVFDTMGLITSIVGMAVLLWLIRLMNKSVEEIGILYSHHKIRKAIPLALMINGISAAVSLGAVWFMKNQGFLYWTIGYSKGEKYYAEGGIGAVAFWGVIALVVSVIHAIFYEAAFRGLMFTLSARSYHFPVINGIQAVSYTVFRLVAVLKLALYNAGTVSVPQILLVAFLMAVYELLAAVRLGWLRRVTGTIWVCMFDHVLFSFLLNMVTVHSTNTGLLWDNVKYLFMIAYQVLATIISIAYYAKEMPKVKEKIARRHTPSGHHHHSHTQPETESASEHVEHRHPHSGEHSHSHSGEHSHSHHGEHRHAHEQEQ